MVELDNKQKLLVAIYTEYQKDLPEMDNIKAEELDISHEIYQIALDKLVNEGYICRVGFSRGGRGNKIQGVIVYDMMMTRDGIDYVEAKLGIEPTMSAGEKVTEVSKKVTAWGYNELKDFTVKVTASLVKSAVGLDS